MGKSSLVELGGKPPRLLSHQSFLLYRYYASLEAHLASQTEAWQPAHDQRDFCTTFFIR